MEGGATQLDAGLETTSYRSSLSLISPQEAAAAAKRRSRDFRRKWVPIIKTILSSAADLVGDWTYYIRTKNGVSGLDVYEIPLFVFCIIASVFGFLTMLALVLKNAPTISEGDREARKMWLGRIKMLLAAEMILEDVPQLILTTMVAQYYRGGEWTGVAVFNVTTSVFNFTFNILDMLMPLPDEKVAGGGAEGGGGDNANGSVQGDGLEDAKID